MKLKSVRFVESVRLPGSGEEVASARANDTTELELAAGLVRVSNKSGAIVVPLGNVRYAEMAEDEKR